MRLMPSLNDIRATFLDYFAAQGHTVAASAPLVPQDDPTLLFVNAGMVPFKNVFTGAEQPRSVRAPPPRRSAFRAGASTRPGQCRLHRAAPHLLRDAGNFSFGDYFKEQADRARLD
jgi:alanyl-tRNA synthetase